MNGYEILSVSVAVIAVGISIISLIRTGKLQRQQLRINELTEKLAKKQLELISKNDIDNRNANITVELNHIGQDYWFDLCNIGNAAALDIDFELIDCKDSPLLIGDYDEKLPIPILQPSQTIKLIAAIHLGSPSIYKARVTWTNQDGSRKVNDYFLSL